MSDTQDDTGAKPTPGPYGLGASSDEDRRILEVQDGNGITFSDLHSKRHPVEGQEPVGNGHLALAAFEAAHEAEEMGYDPVEAVEALPVALEQARCAIIDLLDGPPGDTSEPAVKSAIKRLAMVLGKASNVGASEIVDDKMLDDALESAEGSGDD